MPKVKVAALLGDQLQQEATTSVPDLPTDVVRHVGTREVPQPGGAAARDPQPLRAVPETSADSDSAALPKYRRMERKNTRLRGDQLDKLSQLTRRLQRTEGRAERNARFPSREARGRSVRHRRQTGITRSSLYRHLPARPGEPVTAAGTNKLD